MSIQTISVQKAAELIENGALLIDIRNNTEYTRKHISGAKSVPTDELNTYSLPENTQIIFTCLSGMRTRQNATLLKDCACNCNEVYLLEGGLNAWERAGLPIEKQENAPLDIMRQVQIAAGSLVLIGAILGALVSPWFYFLCAFVGAGLIFAGITGFCGMARLLLCMPWNRS